MIKRLSPLLVSAALFLQVPTALAAYDSPADLLKAIQSDATPRSMSAEMHFSYTAEDPVYVSAWVRGRSQGQLADAQGESSATIDVAMPSEDVKARVKARARVVDQTFYGLLESVTGKLGEDEESVRESIGQVLGKWVSMKIDPALAKESGIDYSALFNEGMLRMERTQGKDGAMYSITIDREFLRGILALGSSFDPSLDASSPEFNFHAVVITDHQERIKNARLYLSFRIPEVSFVLQATSEALPTGFKVRVPADAIPMDMLTPSFPEGEWGNVPSDPRSAGMDKYEARAAARALRQKSVKKPVSSKLPGDILSFGQESAPVTITEYTDYQCPFCRTFHAQTYPLIKKEYIDMGKVRFVIKQYPLSSIHEGALPAAMAVQCALDQGNALGQAVSDAMWTLQDAGNELNSLHIRKYAAMFNDLDQTAFSDCFTKNRKQDVIDRQMAEGDAAGVFGTPAFFLENRAGQTSELAGAYPFEEFQKAIDALLK